MSLPPRSPTLGKYERPILNPLRRQTLSISHNPDRIDLAHHLVRRARSLAVRNAQGHHARGDHSGSGQRGKPIDLEQVRLPKKGSIGTVRPAGRSRCDPPHHPPATNGLPAREYRGGNKVRSPGLGREKARGGRYRESAIGPPTPPTPRYIREIP